MRSIKPDRNMNHTEYRNMIYSFFERKLKTLTKISSDVIVITERISIRESKGGLSQSYVKSTAALIATIIDICDLYRVSVYSVDSRSWKSQIVGTNEKKANKFGIPPEKYPTIEYIRQIGLLNRIVDDCVGKKKNGVIWARERATGVRKKVHVNDNLADSYCIAKYGFLPKEKQKLQEEKF